MGQFSVEILRPPGSLLSGNQHLTLNMPLVLTGQVVIPWLFILLLMFGPTIMSFLQLALSRSREFDADLSAAILTGDPRGLASALAKLERQGRFWENLFLPQQHIPDPSLLRTHPPTEERIRRLIDLAERPPARAELPRPPAAVLPVRMRRVDPPPRRRWSGLWY